MSLWGGIPNPGGGGLPERPQPPYDPAMPHMVYPKEVYERLLATPDEVLTQMASYTAPPVA